MKLFVILLSVLRHRPKEAAQPLRVEDVRDAPMTAEPGDAELAAAALLEHMCEGRGKKAAKPQAPDAVRQPPESGTLEYYGALADRIRQAHETARIRALRFVAYCEEQLKNRHLPESGDGSLPQLESGLYKHLDTVDRDGGEIKRRWQHCLAEVTVRSMETGSEKL